MMSAAAVVCNYNFTCASKVNRREISRRGYWVKRLHQRRLPRGRYSVLVGKNNPLSFHTLLFSTTTLGRTSSTKDVVNDITPNSTKKALGETQTLRAGCSKAEPKIFVPLQTPSRGRATAKI